MTAAQRQLLQLLQAAKAAQQQLQPTVRICGRLYISSRVAANDQACVQKGSKERRNEC
jgi:hypothetical protein